MEKTNEKMIKLLENDLETDRKTLAKFAIQLQQDPAYAFSWGMDALHASARIHASTTLISELKENSLESVVANTIRMVLSAATYPEHSTSPLSDLTKQATVAAFAHFLMVAR